MPTYTIETPLGKRLKIEGDSEEEAVALADQWAADTDAVVRTVYGEAANDPESQAGVASVILNRSNLSGKAPREVVTAPGQFEPWSRDDARARMESLDPRSEEYQTVLQRVSPALNGEDVTGGATHFYAPKAQTALGRPAPEWDDGSGVDYGAHRFFRRPGDFGGGGRPQVEVGDVEFAGMPQDQATTSAAGDGTVYNAKTGQNLNAAQTSAYQELQKAGKVDRNARAGTEGLPLAQIEADVLPEPGQWYVSLDGKLQQVPGGPEHTPLARTAANLAIDAARAFPMTSGIAAVADRALADDPRAQAVESGLLSALMLGGKNEAGAAVDAIPSMFGGGVDPAHRRFAESLKARDAEDRTLEANFPTAMNVGRVYGAAAGAPLIPEVSGVGALGSLARGAQASAFGGAGGFLSTDGSMEDRIKAGAIGAVASPVIGAAIRPLVRGMASAEITPRAVREADQALQVMGTSTADLSPEGQAALQGLIQRGHRPADAARMVMAQDLPTPIPMTQGDVTGLPTDQLDFNLARRGARGDRAAQFAQDFTAGQQEAMRTNVGEILTGMGAGRRPMYGEGGVRASEALSQAERASMRGVDTAYDTARQMSEGARLPAQERGVMNQAVREALRDYDISGVPRVQSILNSLDQSPTSSTFTPRDIFDARAKLTKLTISQDAVEASAAGSAVRAIDDYTEDALNRDLIEGDPEVLRAWRTAIGARRTHGRLFQGGDLVERLTERTGYGEAARLAVDPGDAANLIFGRSALGVAGRRGLYTDLTKIRGMVDEPTWNALRAEPFQRLALGAESGVENGAQAFSGVKFLKSWNDMKARDMRLVETLYTPQEIARINRFAATSARVMSPARGGDNSSNTAVAALRVASGRLFKALPWLGDTLVKQVDELLGDRAVRQATQPEARRAVVGPLGSAPGRAGGAAAGRIASPRDDSAPAAPGFSR